MFKKIQSNLKITKEGETNIIESLYKYPKKDKGRQIPHYKNGGADPNQVYSADLLFMPNDKGYIYLLVCVDTITGITDAIPIKDKDAETVLNAFKTMFAKGVLPMPKWSIQVDDGGEFKSVVKKYFDEHGVLVRYGKVERSRQQAMAENRNKIIAKALFQKQVGQEILTKQTSTEWVDDVQLVLDSINEYEKEQYQINKKKADKREAQGKSLPYLDKNQPILAIGTKVRLKLVKPVGVLGEKLMGQFRATDIKWETTISTITNIILTPDQPIMYQVDKQTPAYTFNQMQVVDRNEKPPSQELLSKQKASMDAVQQTLDKAIPQVMVHAIEATKNTTSDELPKKKAKTKATNAYTPVPITTITPKQTTRAGRVTKSTTRLDL